MNSNYSILERLQIAASLAMLSFVSLFVPDTVIVKLVEAIEGISAQGQGVEP